MLITSNSSPASGELLEDDADRMTLPADSVPESSHTIEIQFVSGIDVYESECTVIEEVDGCFRTCDDTDVQANFDYSEGLADGDRPALEFEATPSSSNECSTDSHDDFGETDLTNLNWLQNITNIMPVPSLSISPKPPPKPLVQNVRLHKFKQTVLKCQEDFAENLEEYRSDDSKKPAYSYCSLICLAMRHNENKMTLSAIYSWIKENFKYYRSADPTWQNSIRHNLSLNKVFVKVARSKHEPGKGGFWKLDLARLEDSRKYKKVPSPPKPPRKQKASAPARKPARGDAGLLREDGDSFDAFEATKRATDSISDMSGQLPDFSLDGLDLVLSDPMESDDFGPNVIVEPVPAEEELGALLLAAPWEDLQPELTDSLFDSYLK